MAPLAGAASGGRTAPPPPPPVRATPRRTVAAPRPACLDAGRPVGAESMQVRVFRGLHGRALCQHGRVRWFLLDVDPPPFCLVAFDYCCSGPLPGPP
ncbi:unnamed protein product [Prorocentrum cordatum]|uniref:Uncharacterized protein n=1 Tax=Prorocentrum cordatum TaxID=2364126 RepID=A0ABN9ULK5_9DINO|nr:unnamed protein product [Polarella glacialis]